MADKPATLGRDTTMDKTVADGVAYLASSAQRSKKPKVQKYTTINRTCEEAKHFVGNLSLKAEAGRQLRKREAKPVKPAPAKKPKKSLKRLGTMANTAKEGNAFLQRKKGAAKDE